MTSIRVGVALALLSLAAAGCSAVTDMMGINPKKTDACVWLSQQTGDKNPNALDLVVIIDRSNSMSTREDRRVRDWYGQLFGAVQPAENSTLVFDHSELPTPTNIRIGSFDGSSRVDWQSSISLPKLAGKGKYSGQFGRNVEKCLKSQVVKAATSASETAGTDVLGAMGSAGRESGTGARQRKMIVVSDGIQTLGCANLRKTRMEKYEQVGRVTANCVAQSGVPDLSGWDVVLSGVGNPAKGWPTPRAGTQTWLTSLWAQLCASAVGESGTCELDTRDPGVTKKEAAEGVDEPVVQFKIVEKPLREVELTLSSRVLFDTNKSDLRPEGRRAINKALTGIDPSTVAWIRIWGYTDSRGSTDFNQGLSDRRADAVADVLRELGMEHVQAQGDGEKHQECAEKGLSGRALAAAQECNRRVKIKYKVRQ